MAVVPHNGGCSEDLVSGRSHKAKHISVGDSPVLVIDPISGRFVPVEEERKQAFPADSASLSRPPLLNSQQDSPNKLFTRVQHNGLFARPPNKPSDSTIRCRLPCSAPIGRRDLLLPRCCVVCAVLIESQSKRLRASGTTRPVQGQLNEDTQAKLADHAA